MNWGKSKQIEIISKVLALITIFAVICMPAGALTAASSASDPAALAAASSASDPAALAAASSAASPASDPSALALPLEIIDGKKIGVLHGTPYEKVLRNVRDPEVYFFNSVPDGVLALREGKIDCFANNTVAFRFVKLEYPELSYIDQELIHFDDGIIFTRNEKGAGLRDEMNAYLAEITASGEMAALKEYWEYPNDWECPEIPSEGERGVLSMCTCTAMKPYAFMLNNQYAGLDIAVAAGFCRANGYGLKIDNTDFSGMLSGIATGRYDLAGAQIAYSDARAENAYYSDFYVEQKVVPYVRTDSYVQGADTGETELSFSEKIKTSFRRTFIEEQRWVLVVKGIGVTLLITVLGFALANLFGAFFCSMTLSESRVRRRIAAIYSQIMQGTPIVVILLLLYYVVFNDSNVSGITVSILGFGLSCGASLAQIFSGNIRAIDEGQMEAALMLGMKRPKAFIGIVLPQAVRSMLPAYFSQLITLMKGTSVVGYIAVMDLTRASDVIRSTTFEALFPLLFSAAVYFLVSCLLLSLLRRIQKKLAPRRRALS